MRFSSGMPPLSAPAAYPLHPAQFPAELIKAVKVGAISVKNDA